MNARARWTNLAGAGVVALLAISAVSCKKSEAVEPASPITVSEFKASAGGHASDSKTTLDDYHVYWTYGDDAMVFSDKNASGQRYVAEGGFGTDKTNFKAAGTAVTGTEFYAVYPYDKVNGSLTTNKVQVTIPAMQTCNEASNFANGANVMAAYLKIDGDNSTADKVSLTFHNVCGLLRLNLKGSATVRTITVRSKGDSDKLCGTGTITFKENDATSPSLNIDNGSNAVCLSCPNGVRLTSEGKGTQFNLVVASCPMASGFDVTVVCDEGTFLTSASGGTGSNPNHIEAGKILDMPAVSVTVMEGALPGLFSVSGTEKVHFSKGNMYWDGNSYEFEANQYDYRMHYSFTGSTNININETAVINGVKQATPGGTVGSFVWVKDENTVKPYKWDVQSSELSGGTNRDVLFTNAEATTPNASFTVNGQAGVWRALSGGGSSGEWEYLLDSRATTYGTGAISTDNRRYAEVKVKGVCGMLVFPDEFSWPAGVGNEPTIFNTFSSSWNGVDYTTAQFSVLEGAGCVFLPCAGNRNGALVYNIGTYGIYWSSSPDNSEAYFLYFHSSNVIPANSNARYHGRSLRLVR